VAKPIRRIVKKLVVLAASRCRWFRVFATLLVVFLTFHQIRVNFVIGVVIFTVSLVVAVVVAVVVFLLLLFLFLFFLLFLFLFLLFVVSIPLYLIPIPFESMFA
jgi:hypothetical protein